MTGVCIRQEGGGVDWSAVRVSRHEAGASGFSSGVLGRGALWPHGEAHARKLRMWQGLLPQCSGGNCQ